MKKLLVISTMLCASLLHAQIRFTQVTPATDQIKIKNFGASDVDISTYRLCALFNYATLSFAPVSIVSGDFLLSQNEVVTLTWPGLNNTQSDLGLYLPTGLFTSPAAMVDFMQYGAAGQGREGVADAAGIWTAGTFLTGTGPWFYIGDGNTTGVTEWMSLPVNVTFSVDMQDQIISPDGVHITGSFQGWTPGTTEMTDVDMDNVYTITLSLAQGDYQYKFINGNDWPGQEIVPMACGVDDGFGGYNREVVVSALPITTPLVCFGSCTVCPPDPVYVEVTFSVDMNNQTVSGDGVHLAGSFQGWDPAATSMSDGDADGIYTVTILVDENTDIEFKYVNGNAWGADEIVPAECAQNNNRFASIGNGDTMLGVVCFAECDACPIIVDPVFVDVTFQVNMQDETVSANGVYVTGTFNGWSATATPLNDGDADNVYAITVLIEENTQIEFKYLNGDDFAGAETVPALCGVDDGFGGLNRIADIGVIAAVLDTVCFSSCMNCNEIIVVPTNMITLQVNMQDQTVSMDGVHVAGNFQGWNPATTEMTDVDMDGIYTVTFEADEWANLSYKFINGNDWPQAEEVPSTCGLPDGNGGYNRILETGSNDVSANVVCFGECDDCEPIIEPVMVNITFSVNMQNETVDANGVHIAGSLQGWDPASTMMTDVDMDGIYTVTLEVEENTTVQYRFINGNDWPMSETVPMACGADDGFGGYNRSFTVTDMDASTAVVCFGECANCGIIVDPVMVNITFQVNMQNETVDANGVHIAGSMQGWDPASTMMTDADMDGIYTVTLEVEENTTVQYRFINGNDWPMSETVPMTCGVDDGFGSYNRSFTVTDMDASTVVICFGECEDCDVIVEPIMVNVTFVVNMENETISANGVHLAGNFQGWDPAATEMTDPGMLAIYSVTVPIEANTVIEYKFVNGNAWGSEEAVPGACATNNNRTASIGNTDMSIDMVCFGECANCGIIVDPVMVNITFQVNMQNETVDANGVHIAGSMQGWDPATTMMTDVDMDGIYTVTLEVEENTTVQYRFINGNDWPMSETVPTACGADDGFGGYNRSFTVTDMDASTVVVCFGECEDCDVIVEPTMVNVTFMVNMQNETVSANGVHVAGNFQGWDPATTIMDDGDADGIFTVTVEIESNTALEYKFVNGNAWGSDESVPAECATNNNRTATVADINLTLDVVCYAGCMDCDDIVEPTTVTVLFQVDMSNEIVSANGVHVAGSFQGWNPNGTVMTDLGGGIYELSYEVEINTTIQFKFINGSDWPQAETVPAECGEDDGFGGINRSLSVGEENIAFGPVCFAACTVCDDVVEPATVEVTFMVDMSNETVSADGVHIAGNFQGWIPATSQMTDDDSDNIYEFTAEVDTNSTVLFKFINGNDWPMQETVPAECGEGDGFGGFNRILEVGEADADYGPVCFASCAECAAAVPVLITFRVDMSNEAVSADGVFIAGDFNGWDATATQMSEYATNLYEAVVVLNSGETVQYKFVNGLTYETVPAECGVGDFLNRSYTASSINETLTPVCFAQCSSCTVIPMVDITFQLDLGTLIADASGVHVAGSFNGWSPSATQMTLAFDNLYTATVTVAENTQVLFKYLNGNDWPMSEVVPFECGVDDGNGGYNRSITVDDVNITLPEVCLGSCVDCPIGVDENELNTFNIFPIPANTSITISAAQTMDETLSIVDATGRAVQTIVMNNVQTMQVNVEALSAGLYQITNNLGQLLGRMVVE